MISVILPVFNGYDYLDDSINSVLNQQDILFELIIVNDASTDNSSEIINKYLIDPRVVYIENPVNKGLFSSLNIGIQQSNGTLIKLWAQDDIMKQNCLLDFVKVNNNCGSNTFFWCLATMISKNDKLNILSEIDNAVLLYDNTFYFEKWELLKVLRHYWFCGNLHGNISNLAFSKEVWLLVGGFNESMVYSGDIDFTVRCLKFCMPVCIPRELVWLRNHQGQLSKNVTKLKFELYETLTVFQNIEEITVDTNSENLVKFRERCLRDRLLPYYTSNLLKVMRFNFSDGLSMLKIISLDYGGFFVLFNWCRVKFLYKFKWTNGFVKLYE
jgi:glycosyltransferase involved in cell wall biosynthesis